MIKNGGEPMGRSSGGGSRSSGGFGGGRSSGGFSNHSRRTSSSQFNHNTHHSYHPYYHRPVKPIFVGPRRVYHPPVGGSNRGYRFASIFVLIAIIFLSIFAVRIYYGNSLPISSSNSVPANTTERTPLQGVVNKTDWYDDELGWIRSSNQLIEGLEHFYDKTGVQPYVMMIAYNEDYWNGSTFNSQAAINYLNSVYDNKFTDEGHFIFAYFSCLNDSESEMDGEFRYLSGYAVDTIMDNEACNIFEGYYFENYYNTSLSTEQLISQTFIDTADSIMSHPTSFWDFAIIAVIVIAAVIIIFILYKLYKTRKKREQEKEEYVKDILDKPLETFGEDTSDLEKKYENE